MSCVKMREGVMEAITVWYTLTLSSSFSLSTLQEIFRHRKFRNALHEKSLTKLKSNWT